MSVYNEPQPDGSVVQYDQSGQVVGFFESDEECMRAMGIEVPMTPIREELKDAVEEGLRSLSDRILGGRSHAA